MTREELNEILDKHKKWLKSEVGGERANPEGANLLRANLRDANLEGANLKLANLKCANLECAKLMFANMELADLEGANLRFANLERANLRGANLKLADLMDANLKHADLRGANLEYADIDYSAWPLWCGSLKAHVDDRIAVQLLYHTLSVVQHSPYVSEEIKRTLLTPDVVKVANRFHRVDECGKLKAHDNVEVSE